MKQGMRLLPAVALCAGLTLPACMSASRPAPPAFFASLPQDAVAVQALIREQERYVQTCTAERTCPRARYLRGLAALYEGRAVARKHFQAVLTAEPNGPYAVSSRNWLLLLDDGRSESARETRLVHAMERVVRQVLENEATRRQLKEREEQIDVLTRQIDALKRVDQEVKDRVKPSRPAE